ncbi:MAG: DNA repair protein RecO [Bacillota bacterium]
MALLKDEGIVVRTRPINEADRIVTILSAKHGKIEAVARGARRPRSRFVGSTLPFTHVVFAVFEGKGMHDLSQAEIISSFPILRNDLLKLAYASYWMDLLENLLEIQQSAEDVFNLTAKALKELSEVDKPALLSRLFELRLADYLGWKPELEACVRCGKTLDAPPYFFSASMGGMVCQACRDGSTGEVPVLEETWQTLNNLQNNKSNRWPQSISRRAEKEMAGLLHDFFRLQTGRAIKSFSFLQEVE